MAEIVNIRTTHSVRLEEQLAFSDWINSNLGGDPDLAHLLPIDAEGKTLYDKVKDGILLWLPSVSPDEDSTVRPRPTTPKVVVPPSSSEKKLGSSDDQGKSSEEKKESSWRGRGE
ncbi:Plastin-3 [Homalodisca vitripennis]|nr:Plastin-3 [Homalodisca vitripennis]